MWKESITEFVSDHNEKKLRAALRKNWSDLYPEDKQKIYHFLYIAKQHKIFMYLFAIDFQSQEFDLPWLETLNIFVAQKVKVSKPILQELASNLYHLGLIGQQTNDLESLLQGLEDQREKLNRERFEARKQELLESAKIAKAEDLLDQHYKYMIELQSMAPNDFNLKTLTTKREQERAEKVISRSLKNRTAPLPNEQVALSSLEWEIAQRIDQQAQAFLAQNKANASDLAYLFRSFGLHQQAIEFTYKNGNEVQRDWQLLEYLFSGKQYLSLLDHCHGLKKKYAEFPDSLFSIAYAEAVAYWELGERNKAVDLMTQISTMRPNFKSATEILAQWKEESFE